jgi:DNA-binding NtrC family response regulator
MYRFIIADVRASIGTSLCGMILLAYPTSQIQTVTLVSSLLDEYALHGADLIILSHTLAHECGRDTLMLLHGMNPTVPVIVYAADDAVGAMIAQNETTRFVNNPFDYHRLARLMAEMTSAEPKALVASETS